MAGPIGGRPIATRRPRGLIRSVAVGGSTGGGRSLEAHELADILARRGDSGRPYLEFIRVPHLSVGLYVLPKGGVDGQQPHAEDEVYHVLEGRALITVGDEARDVGPGSTVYVAAGVPHRFHAIETELRVLVFFAPAESAPATSGPAEPRSAGDRHTG